MRLPRRWLAALAALLGSSMAALAVLFWMGYRDLPDAPAHRSGTAQSPGAGAPPDEDTANQIERGRYLAALGNCMGCHTGAGGQPYAGGREIATPFGVFVGPNLTSDTEHGIGAWSAEDFWRALRHGKRPDGSLLYPVFPYTSYRHMTREDADAIHAFLRSLPPAAQPDEPHRLAFPYSQRPLIALWRALYAGDGAPDAAGRDGGVRDDGSGPSGGEDARWLRGRYLVEGLAHCAECHTARNRFGGWTGAPLAGGMIPGQNWYAPALAGGLERWSAQDIADLLRTGLSRHSYASGPMAESVRNGFQYATAEDALAMGVYIKSLAPSDTVAAVPSAAPDYGMMETGRKHYAAYCAQCHQSDGSGVPQAWPPLAGNPSVTAPSPANAIQMVLYGGFAPATGHHPRPHGMPPFAHVLDDAGVAAVVTYIRNSWGNAAGPASLPQVRQARQAR